MAADARKPMWMSFCSAHTVDQLLNVIDEDTTSITFDEVLPDDDSLWLHDAGQSPLVVEHLTHLRRGRPPLVAGQTGAGSRP